MFCPQPDSSALLNGTTRLTWHTRLIFFKYWYFKILQKSYLVFKKRHFKNQRFEHLLSENPWILHYFQFFQTFCRNSVALKWTNRPDSGSGVIRARHPALQLRDPSHHTHFTQMPNQCIHQSHLLPTRRELPYVDQLVRTPIRKLIPAINTLCSYSYRISPNLDTQRQRINENILELFLQKHELRSLLGIIS